MHFVALLSPISQNLEEIETMSEAKKEDIALNRILKSETDEKLDDFLNITIKISSKKRQLLNTSKHKSI